MNEFIKQAIDRSELDTVVAGNTLAQYLTALIVIGLVLVVGYTIKGLLKRFFSRKSSAPVEDPDLSDSLRNLGGKVIAKTRFFFILTIALLCGLSFVNFPARAENFVSGVLLTLVFLQFWMWASVFIEMAIIKLYERTETDAQDEESLKATLPALLITAKAVSFALVILLALDNFGIDVTALIAGLGIGGIAIALAAQSIFSDLFASMSIILDKPFRVGDFVVVGDLAGTVAKIGLKTTRVRSLGGEQLIFSNSDLLSSRIKNYKRMQERRIVFNFGLLYQTPAEKVERAVEIVKKIIEDDKMTRFDRAHFFKFGDSSLDFEVVYFILSPQYNDYMDAQQRINLAMMRQFAELGVDFAYPTRTLFIEDVNIQSSFLKKIVNS